MLVSPVVAEETIMLQRLASLFVVALVGAFVPVFNVEAYIVGLHLYTPEGAVLPALVAAAGQTIGKLAWYEAGRGARKLPWLGTKLDKPSFRARSERWRAKLEGHPWVTAAVLLGASTVSVPPLLVMAVVAGHLRVHRLQFTVIVFVGRFARFYFGLGLLDLLHRP